MKTDTPSISPKAYGQGSERLTELGRQIGGWRRFAAGIQKQP